jgi:hypothetical protein
VAPTNAARIQCSPDCPPRRARLTFNGSVPWSWLSTHAGGQWVGIGGADVLTLTTAFCIYGIDLKWQATSGIMAITGQCQMSDAYAIRVSITYDPFKKQLI